jgi:hypothetical protein
MPVSKKRKKDGKPVQRSIPVSGEEHPHGPEAKPAEHPLGRGGKPTNPFVQQQQGRRGAQRGR